MARSPCFAFHACQSAPLPPEGELDPVPYSPPMLLLYCNLRGAVAVEGVSTREREEERERKRWRAQEAGACAGRSRRERAAGGASARRRSGGAQRARRCSPGGRTHRSVVTAEPGSACAMAIALASPMLLFVKLRGAAAEEGVSARKREEERDGERK